MEDIQTKKSIREYLPKIVHILQFLLLCACLVLYFFLPVNAGADSDNESGIFKTDYGTRP